MDDLIPNGDIVISSLRQLQEAMMTTLLHVVPATTLRVSGLRGRPSFYVTRDQLESTWLALNFEFRLLQGCMAYQRGRYAGEYGLSTSRDYSEMSDDKVYRK